MRAVFIDGKWVWYSLEGVEVNNMSLPEHRFCPVCHGILKDSEDECPVCKARAYEAQVLKDRLKVIG